MVGKFDLVLRNNYVEYDLTFDRNITILTGDSNKGKSYFVDLLEITLDELENSDMSTSFFYTNFDMVIVSRRSTKKGIEEEIYSKEKKGNCLIVLDESNGIFKKSEELLDLVENVDSYFLFVGREIKTVKGTGSLPYSVKSVYKLNTKKKGFVNSIKEIYSSEFKLLFDYFNTEESYESIDVVFTEDSCSGFRFFVDVLNMPVYNTGGKGRYRWSIGKYLRSNVKGIKNILFIADGAAFGCHFYDILNYKRELQREYGVNLILSLPESFEWLVLNTPLFSKFVSKEIKYTYNYCDSLKYLSWERFYTYLLEDKSMSKYNIGYSKKIEENEASELIKTEKVHILSQIENELNGYTVINLEEN